MLLEVHQERMLVISDLHLGNPYSLASEQLRDFLDWAITERYSLCINGDGLEILQASFTALAAHSMDIIHHLRRFSDEGLGLYYIVGNHDITLEHLLNGWMGEHISPFLNVYSGDLRIRVEHGHLYDPFFVRSPRLYAMCTTAMGPVLHVYPDVYRLWSWYQRFKESRRKASNPDVPGHGSSFHEAAEMLLSRGFDIVVFGHTHKPEVSSMDGGGVYINSGNWMREATFVQIDDGKVQLLQWDGQRPQLVQETPKLLTG